MKLGVYQSPADAGTTADRIAGLKRVLEGQRLDLVLCPELFATGYDPSADYSELAESSDGPFAKAIADLAKATGTALVYGYPERGNEGVYNSAALIGKDGELLANHRKRLQSPQSFEERAFLNGDAVTFADIHGMRVAMIICYEVEFPESLRQAASGGAQLVLVPTALGADWGIVAEKVVPTRAFENGIWLAYADHAGALRGTGFFGGSRIVAPDGEETVAPIGYESLIKADIDLDRVRKAQSRLPYFRDRKCL